MNVKKAVLLLAFAAGLAGRAQAQVEELAPGAVEGSGVHFAVVGGTGPQVVVDSAVEITASIHSVDSVVTLKVAGSTAAASTELVVSGLAPSTTYYKYEDDLHALAPVTTDAEGRLAFSQDLLADHVVFIKAQPSTWFIGATGGDCAAFGVWDAATLTCTLTTDVTDTIQIDADNVTLDGAGFGLIGTHTGQGVYLPTRTGVVVKNLHVTGQTWGVYATAGTGNIIVNNTFTDCFEGIFLDNSNGNTISANLFSGAGYAVWANWSSSDNSITGNVFTGNGDAIWLNGRTVRNFVQGNTMEANGRAIYLSWFASSNTIVENTFSNGREGIAWGYAWGNTIVNNNFVNNTVQASNYRDFCSLFSLALPKGGNYWSDFDTADEGCADANGDRICDAPYTRIYNCSDALPWTTPDGWKVVTPADVVVKIEQYLADGSIDVAGVANALSSMLENAAAAYESGNETAADNQIGAFINYVNAQTDKHITAEAAAALIAAANSIRTN